VISNPSLLSKAQQRYPNHYLLVRIISERVKQLKARQTSGQLSHKVMHRALEEAAAGELRIAEGPKQPRGAIVLGKGAEEIEKAYADSWPVAKQHSGSVRG
jgi:DNA-directed RNA polymerase subunit K/omega